MERIDIYTISKDEIKKILYKSDVDIIYTSEKVIVCKKGSIKEFGNLLSYVYATKGKCDY